jgi:uncharacterized protein (TIGR02611 family)
VNARGRLTAFRARVRALPGGRIAWRLAITVVGVGVIAIGIVLLPLPGPGWLIIFAGLGLLATEYAWARRLLQWLRAQFVRWSRWLADQPLWVQSIGTVMSLAVIGAVALAAWWFVQL